VQNVVIDGNVMANNSDTDTTLLLYATINDMIISDNMITNSGDYSAIWSDSQTVTDLKISGNYLESNDDGSGADTIVLNCAVLTNAMINDNYILNDDSGCIDIDGPGGATGNDLMISNNNMFNSSSAVYTMSVVTMDRLVVGGNSITNGSTYGVLGLNGCDGASITGNYFRQSGNSSVVVSLINKDRFSFSGNVIDNSAANSYGLGLTTCTDGVVSNNTFMADSTPLVISGATAYVDEFRIYGNFPASADYVSRGYSTTANGDESTFAAGGGGWVWVDLDPDQGDTIVIDNRLDYRNKYISWSGILADNANYLPGGANQGVFRAYESGTGGASGELHRTGAFYSGVGTAAPTGLTYIGAIDVAGGSAPENYLYIYADSGNNGRLTIYRGSSHGSANTYALALYISYSPAVS
jgi:hypothetical protein